MKVLYDISLLGSGYYDPLARTGVFRVIENIAYGLANSKECDLSFCTIATHNNISISVACLDYLEANLKFEKVPFAHPKIKRLLHNQIKPINEKIDNAYGLERLLLKSIRKPLLYSKGFVEYYTNLIDSKSLAAADIFHSPLHPIPKRVRQNRKTKNFLTVHDLIPILYPKFFTGDEHKSSQEITLKSLESEDFVICVSQSTKNDLCNYLKIFDSSRVFVTPLAAAPDFFYPCLSLEKVAAIRKKYNIPDARYILSLCTLEPRKNIDHTIRCFAKMIQEQNIQDLYLVLVGAKGWSYDKVFEEITNFELAKNRIILVGYVADQDLAALYSGALAFAYLSFYEGFGLPPLEAMQCGIPVITSNTSSLPEVVGDAAIRLEPLDVDGLCQSMLEIYSDSSLRKSMSLKSIEQAKKFSWERCTQETIAAYKTALSV
ncbi:glycosyltransferase family 4 protein [Scytonema sp. PRP1]|uniref:glycosyltransferase family 4 protein n=1 Tax=Scytonema sp. PRP1 TaxID=3120513 RepID=UPI002FD20FD9